VLTGANALNLTLAGATRLLEGDARFAQGFEAVSSATWTAEAVYDAGVGRTLLTNRNADWTSDALAGKLLNPNIAQSQWALVVANTSVTLTVVGNVTGFVPLGASYRFADGHLLDGSAALDRAATGTLVSIDFEGDGRPGAMVGPIWGDEAPGDLCAMADTVCAVSYAYFLRVAGHSRFWKLVSRASDAESGLAGVELFYSKDGGAFVLPEFIKASRLRSTRQLPGGWRICLHKIALDQSGNANRRLRHRRRNGGDPRRSVRRDFM
jgi:hypothetical protein